MKQADECMVAISGRMRCGRSAKRRCQARHRVSRQLWQIARHDGEPGRVGVRKASADACERTGVLLPWCVAHDGGPARVHVLIAVGTDEEFADLRLQPVEGMQGQWRAAPLDEPLVATIEARSATAGEDQARDVLLLGWLR